MAISSARDVSIYVKNEASYGAAEAPTATDYLRCTTAQVSNDQLAAIPSPEKTPGRDKVEVFRGRPTTSLSLGTLLRGAPTGVTPPRSTAILENAMGADRIVVDAAADVTGGNTGKGLFVAGATDGMFRPHVGGAATPLIPLSGSAIYKSVNFVLGSDRKSSTVRYQPQEAGATPPGAPAQLVTGYTVNTMTLNIDGSGSPATVEFEGPAARCYHGVETLANGGAGANVAVPDALSDDQPLSGLVAKVWFRRVGQSGAFTELTSKFRSLTLTLANNIGLRMDEAGSLYSTGVKFDDNRMTTLALTTWAESNNPLWEDVREGLAGNVPRSYSLFVALGDKEGSRVGFYAPKWLPGLPSGDDGDAGIGWEITGELLASAWGSGESSFSIGLG